MKFDTKQFEAAFKIIDQVDNNTGFLSSRFVRLSLKDGKLSMALTGIMVAEAFVIAQDVGSNFVWYVDRRMLKAFLDATKAKGITVDLQKDALLFRSGRQKVTAAGIDEVTGYSSWEPSKDTARPLKLTDDLRKELSVNAFYADKGVNSQYGAVVLVRGYGVLSSDSFAIIVRFDKTEARSYKLPVLLAETLWKDASAASVLVDKNGAGIQYPDGYLYQPLTADAITGYPIKALSDVIAAQMPVKSVVRIKAKPLFDALVQMKGYTFETADVLVTCSNARAVGYAVVQLDIVQGKAETALPADFKADFRLTWPLAKLYPWVEWLATSDPDVVITCGNKDGLNAFSAGKRLLVIAETA